MTQEKRRELQPAFPDTEEAGSNVGVAGFLPQRRPRLPRAARHHVWPPALAGIGVGVPSGTRAVEAVDNRACSHALSAGGTGPRNHPHEVGDADHEEPSSATRKGGEPDRAVDGSTAYAR